MIDKLEWAAFFLFVAWLLVGCYRNPYYTRISMKKTLTATAITCDADNCGKPPSNMALPSMFFSENQDQEKIREELEKIVEAINQLYPGKKVLLMPDESPVRGYERLPIRWRDQPIWVEKFEEST